LIKVNETSLGAPGEGQARQLRELVANIVGHPEVSLALA
jgi:hypothetical protein